MEIGNVPFLPSLLFADRHHSQLKDSNDERVLGLKNTFV